MGRREQKNRKRKAAGKSCQCLDTWVSKIAGRQEPSDADNDSAVCDDSSAETTTSDLSQLRPSDTGNISLQLVAQHCVSK